MVFEADKLEIEIARLNVGAARLLSAFWKRARRPKQRLKSTLHRSSWRALYMTIRYKTGSLEYLRTITHLRRAPTPSARPSGCARRQPRRSPKFFQRRGCLCTLPSSRAATSEGAGTCSA